MKYTQLRGTGLKVSRLVLGTMNFGPLNDEADSHAIMDAALDAGINFFDSANVYGRGEKGPYRGDHRQLVREGRRAARQGRPRHQGVRQHGRRGRCLAQPRQSVGAEHPPCRGRLAQASPDRLHRCLPVPPHRPGHPVRGDLAGHRRTRPAGEDPLPRVLHFPGCKIAQANEIAARRGTIGLVSEQCLYNLYERRAEMEVIPAAQEYGLGVIPWSSLHGGALGGV